MSELAKRAAAAVDRDRLWRRLMQMAEIGATPAGGVNRQALSPEDTAAKRLLAGWDADGDGAGAGRPTGCGGARHR